MRSTPRAHSPSIESLESRQLLSADLSIVGASLFYNTGKGVGSVVVSNTGTVSTKGTFDVSFYATAKGQPDQLLGRATGKSAKLAPHAVSTFAVKLTRPVNTTKKTINYKIVERLTPHTTPADSKPANNTFNAGSLLVNPPSTSGGSSTANPFASLHIGNVYHFKKTSSSVSGTGGFKITDEDGTFTDNLGRTGTYELVLTPTLAGHSSTTLDIEIASTNTLPSDTLLFQFSSITGVTTFSKKTVTINLDSKNAQGTAKLFSTNNTFRFHVA
ncbi:MAG TPA: hypothetical protein VFE58_15170 [Tepidisphaeraceae bacterium]|jgi:hypothetical protein|nr:hypothetical protein [Tepidisphaeraceae bacterium]